MTIPEDIFPFFQPIISVSDGAIYGYESLGRRIDENGKVISLGPVFHDPDISSQEKLELDRLIRRMAVERFAATQEGKLFLNMNPFWLASTRPEEEPRTVSIVRAAGIDPRRVVIEITEEQFNAHPEDLNAMLSSYRSFGFRIAVDDFTFENFDRLIYLKPDIVKMDIRLLKKSVEKTEYRKLIHSISNFAQEIGISVLFEGVENEDELENAIQAGGSLVQGFLFSRAEDKFRDRREYESHIRLVLGRVINKMQLSRAADMEIEKRMNRLLDELLAEKQPDDCELEECVVQLLPGLPARCRKAYLCDENGTQLTPNFMRADNQDFERDEDYVGRNWGWRPYFIDNLIRMQHLNRGVVSTKYVDVITKQEIITFSYPLFENRFIFLDFVL